MVCFPLTGLFAPLVVSRICETHALLTENGAASVVQMASACVAGAATARLSGVGATLGMVRDTRRALSFGVGTPGRPVPCRDWLRGVGADPPRRRRRVELSCDVEPSSSVVSAMDIGRWGLLVAP